MELSHLKKSFLFTGITIIYTSILYYLVFYVFGDYNDYVLCTKIELFESSISSFNFKYLYTRSCDEEPYFIVFENIKNLYTVDSFQYRNRPMFLIFAYLINKFLSLFNFDTQNLMTSQLSYFILQNLILTITAVLFNIAINIKNTFKNYSFTALFLLLSPIYKWTIFEAGSHTQTGLILVIAINIYKKKYYLESNYLPIFISFMYLSHRSFVVLFLYCAYLIVINKEIFSMKVKKIFKFSFYFIIPISSYELFKYFFTTGQDHSVEFYNQFFWVFDFLRGIDTNGVTGWYCQQLPQNFKCYLNDNLMTLKYLYVPLIFGILYLYIKRKTFFVGNFWRPLIEISILVNIFWSFIGWYPPIRFSFYSWGHLIVFVSIIIFYNLTSKVQKTLFTAGYIFYFMFLNHYNADIYFELSIFHSISIVLYFFTILSIGNTKMLKSNIGN